MYIYLTKCQCTYILLLFSGLVLINVYNIFCDLLTCILTYLLTGFNFVCQNKIRELNEQLAEERRQRSELMQSRGAAGSTEQLGEERHQRSLVQNRVGAGVSVLLFRHKLY